VTSRPIPAAPSNSSSMKPKQLSAASENDSPGRSSYDGGDHAGRAKAMASCLSQGSEALKQIPAQFSGNPPTTSWESARAACPLPAAGLEVAWLPVTGRNRVECQRHRNKQSSRKTIGSRARISPGNFRARLPPHWSGSKRAPPQLSPPAARRLSEIRLRKRYFGGPREKKTPPNELAVAVDSISDAKPWNGRVSARL